MNPNLLILQDRVDGDKYEAAQRLAEHLERVLGAQNPDGDLSDWLAEGDYDGSETIGSLMAEWEEMNSY